MQKTTRRPTTRTLFLAATLIPLGCQDPPIDPALVENGLRPRLAVAGADPWTIEERMAHYGVPGVAVAVVERSRIAWARGYGVTERGGDAPVTEETLFQSLPGSILVSELAALKTAAEGKLSLDAPIHDALRSWQVPDNELTEDAPITLRHLLMHTSGLSPRVFPGYKPDDELPSLLQVLTGEPPANSAALRVISPPGNRPRQSGGGMAVVQQALVDVRDRPFPELVQELVLGPLEMSASTFQQPLPAELLARAASGHRGARGPLEGKANVYPELAASGLWTTASDLAKLLVEIQNAVRGDGAAAVLAVDMAQATIVPALVNAEDAARLTMRGFTEGFYSEFVIFPHLGTGAVVLTNSSDGRPLAVEVFQALARAYGWPNFLLPEIHPVPLSSEEADLFAGRYAVGEGGVLRITAEGDHLLVREVPARYPEALYRVSEDAFINQERGRGFSFRRDRDGRATAYVWTNNNSQETVYPRLRDETPRAVELLEAGRLEEAIESYRGHDTPPREGRLNGTGYELLAQGEAEKAVAVFELACELYPASANAFDSLADGRLALDDLEGAAEAFEQLLLLLPFDEQLRPLTRDILEAKARYHLRRYQRSGA